MIDPKRAAPFAQRLELTGSLRYEHQSGEVDGAANARRKGSYASTTTATGLRFEPVVGLTLRVSYGEGFTPPSVGSIGPRWRCLAAPRRRG